MPMKSDELAIARQMLEGVKEQIKEAAGSDENLAFALRRCVYRNLSYEERGTPAHRNKLKRQKLAEQGGKCAYAKCTVLGNAICMDDEPELDRLEAIKGYTPENTVLVHHDCHRASQESKNFS